VIQAAAWHHHPAQSANKSFSALTSIHIANALEHESNPDPDGLPVSMMDKSYLQEIGLEKRLPEWCRALGFALPVLRKATSPHQPSRRRRCRRSRPLLRFISSLPVPFPPCNGGWRD
jgi:hypothetical protein